MSDGWIRMPEDVGDLPWSVRAGRPMLWFIDFADGQRFSRQQFVGRLNMEGQPSVQSLDKQTGIYVRFVKAYRELLPEPVFD